MHIRAVNICRENLKLLSIDISTVSVEFLHTDAEDQPSEFFS